MNDLQEPAIVMVIDDTPANLRLLQAHFHRLGYKVMAFLRGAAALEAAALSRPDVILLDINMPEMDGFQVCALFKKDEGLKDIPVIFISALSEPTDKIKAFAAGAVDYVTKPFDMEEVRARVETHLELKKRERALAKANKELKELEELRDGFVHLLIHDLRSPLAGVRAVFQLLATEKREETKSIYVIEGQKATEKLIRMVSTVLDVHRMESHKLNISLSLVDPRAIVDDSIEMLSALIADRKISVRSFGTDESFYCDADLISRVVQNLISNAVNHTNPKNGAIVVELGNQVDHVRISVEDNGLGIAEEHLDKIFEKFGQVSGRRYSSGLGLTFCKLAVEAHGGEIGVKSTINRGSLFWFTVPNGRGNYG